MSATVRDVARFSSLMVLMLMVALSVGCQGSETPVPAPVSSASSVTATIGTAGGTVTGPDGVQVVIPPGALDADTTIGIARNTAGAPARLTDGQPAGPIYEFTPHDLIFNKPVRFFMPVPAGTVTAAPLIASFGQGWESWEAVVVNGFAQWSRNTFSWVGLNIPCASTGSNDPHPCAGSSGKAFVTATPSDAITQLTGVENPLGFFTGVGNAGSYAVNTTTLTELRLTMLYRGTPDCTNGRARLKRLIPGAGGPAQLITPPGEITAPLDANARGTVTFNIPWDPNTTATTAYVVQFSCDRPDYNPGGGYTTGGFDWFTFIPSASGVQGFTYGGTVTGLTSSGLELQNGPREVLTVPANSTAFTFLTRLAAGSAYNISVRTQPAGQHCTVQNGTSSPIPGITSDVTNIAVTCAGITIGGTVSGLTGTAGLVLQNNGGNDLPITANGAFTFANQVAVGGNYNVTVLAQPTGQACTVTNGSGTANINVTNVTVTCVTGGGGAPAIHPGKLSLGFRHTCALTSDDRLACWGSNGSQQIGQPNPQSPSYGSPLIVPLVGPVTGVEAGQSETCAIHNGGQMSCWGSIGGTNIPTLQATAGTVSSIAMSFAHRCFIAAGTVYCAGANDWGMLGQGTTNSGSATPLAVSGAVAAGSTPIALVGGTYHTCALSNAGEVRCWGRINSQSDALGNPVATPTPTVVAGLPAVVDIGAGDFHTCAVSGDGSVWCWGANAAGQQGNGSTSAVFTTVAAQVPGVSAVIAVGVGAYQTCVVQSDGRVRCWGTGQMGNGNVTTTQPTPSLVSSLTNARTVTVASGQHVCVLTSARGAKCWGSNAEGQIGTGSPGGALTTPTDVVGSLQYWWAP